MKKILFIVLVAFAATFVACDKEDDNLVSVSVTASEGGTVAGDNGKHNVGTELKFVAIPDNGYSFSCWSDGNQSNPRTVTVQNADIILVALFANNEGNSEENDGENNAQFTDSLSIKDIILGGICWGGKSLVSEKLEQRNYMSNYYFLQENGYNLGFEESFYQGVYDTTMEFSWFWVDDSYQILCMNFEGIHSSEIYYINILNVASGRINGVLYQSLEDYEYDQNSGSTYSRRGISVQLKRNDDFDREYLGRLLNEWRNNKPESYVPIRTKRR